MSNDLRKKPRLRSVKKKPAPPPYPLNEFPQSFGDRLGRELVYLIITKQKPGLSGEEWEEIFARCIDAQHEPSNIGLDDVSKANCAWGAKTVKINTKKSLATVSKVRLISGRNSPVYSFDEKSISPEEADPERLGKEVLEIWNARVREVKSRFQYLRTVVLLRKEDLRQVAVFEFETTEYDPANYIWKWNKRNNLEGHEKSTLEHRFTWQPHGSQFTIIVPVPEKVLVVEVQKDIPRLDVGQVLTSVGFQQDWVKIETVIRQ